MKNKAMQSIASYLGQCDCKTFSDAVQATQVLLDAAEETKLSYQNHPEALRAQTAPTIN
ncbi:hypothetical protein [Pseudoalteromonas rubra]|uniref:hypothetical protein n=1 Tax=Pseudoalteromonas rubra TaxID=43658 RepID=UPI0014866296|nr:hypothetical protein [Pseudoalteromonas rubra]